MRRLISFVVPLTAVLTLSSSLRAQDDQKVKAILDKAVQALGGEAKLKMITAASWKTSAKIYFGDIENSFTGQTTVQGLDRMRNEFEGEFNGNAFKGVTVLNGNQGWRMFADMVMEIDEDGIVNEKRNHYLQMVPMTLVPLKGNGFKVEAAADAKVGDKDAAALKVTGPDGKDFTLYFDKENGLPVKLVAQVLGFMGEEFTQETSFGDYKDFDGIKKATKIVSLRDGEKFLEATVTEFKRLGEVYPETFDEPQ